MSVVDKEIDYWYTTVSGKHIPVFKGETKIQALERVKEKKTDIEKINDFQKRQDTKSKHPPVLHSLFGGFVITTILDHHVGIFHVVTDHVIESDVEFEKEVVHCE